MQAVAMRSKGKEGSKRFVCASAGGAEAALKMKKRECRRDSDA